MFGDQTMGARTRKKDIAIITNGTGKNTCKRKKKSGLGNKRTNCDFMPHS